MGELTIFFVTPARGVRRALVFIATLAREHHIERKVGAARKRQYQQEPVFDEPVDHENASLPGFHVRCFDGALTRQALHHQRVTQRLHRLGIQARDDRAWRRRD